MNQTPFHNKHLELKGKMVDFHGWELPVQYSTITLEHKAVREHVGLFDISHMGQVFIWGKDAEAYLQNLVTNNIEKAVVGKGVYAHMLNQMGGVIDDIYVFRMEPERFFVVVNAATKEGDFQWMDKQKKSFDVQLMEAPQAAGLALQGPKAVEIIHKLAPDAANLKKNGIGEYKIGDSSALVSRTGYTGEDGFEFFAPAGHLILIWDYIFKVGKEFGLTPCGLGARDTLRTEVGYPLYGHELDDKHTPFESGLNWVVKLDKGTFIGRAPLLQQKTDGLKTKLFGFKVESGGVARPGGRIVLKNNEFSEVASGTFSPSLGYAIGTCFLPADTLAEGEEFTIHQGTRELKAKTVKMPFLRRTT